MNAEFRMKNVEMGRIRGTRRTGETRRTRENTD